MYKALMRPHLDYGNIIYDETYNKTFHQNFETFQYNAFLALSGAIRGSSKKKKKFLFCSILNCFTHFFIQQDNIKKLDTCTYFTNKYFHFAVLITMSFKLRNIILF